MKAVAQHLAWGRHLVRARCCHHDYPWRHQHDPGPTQRDLSLGLFLQTPPATPVAGGTGGFVTGRPLLRPTGREALAQTVLWQTLPGGACPPLPSLFGASGAHAHTRTDTYTHAYTCRGRLSSELNFLVPASSGAPGGRRQHRKHYSQARVVSSERPDHDWGPPRAQPAPVRPETASVS